MSVVASKSKGIYGVYSFRKVDNLQASWGMYDLTLIQARSNMWVKVEGLGLCWVQLLPPQKKEVEARKSF